MPLISASPSLAVSSIGSIPARASASAAGNSAPSVSTTDPSPISTKAQCASGARSPLAPKDPCSGTTGVSPARSSARIRSATSGRAPEHPIANVRARSTIIARTTSRSTGGPIPAAWDRTSARCSCARASAGIRTIASEPNPVEIPYAGSSEDARSATTAALRSIASRASSLNETTASSRATATTSAADIPPAPSDTLPVTGPTPAPRPPDEPREHRRASAPRRAATRARAPRSRRPRSARPTRRRP